MSMYPTDSPVDKLRKTMPRGNAEWAGWDIVYNRLKEASDFLGSDSNTRLGSDHIYVMAAMVTGHEETMKAAQDLAITYGWCPAETTPVQKFVIKATNSIGSSKHIMTLSQINNYNKVAAILAKRCMLDGKSHSSGMWTVEKFAD